MSSQDKMNRRLEERLGAAAPIPLHQWMLYSYGHADCNAIHDHVLVPSWAHWVMSTADIIKAFNVPK
jgi:hypothetical protein